MKQYEKYINTGYKFLSTLPEKWELKLGISCFEENKRKNSDLGEKLLLQFYYGSIIRKANQEIKESDEAVFAKYTVVEPSDIMLNGLNLNYDFVSQRVGIVKEKGAITSAYLALRCRALYNPFYANYLLKSLDAQKVFHGMGSGVRLTLGYPEFSRIQFPVPPKDEQDQIVRFLDWQLSLINHLINGYQKQIKLLSERRQTIIDQATTQGIDDVKLKVSGVNWLPNIPEHWNMVYSKKLFAQRKDKAFPEDIQLTSSQKYGIISQEEFMCIEGRRLTVVMTGSDILKHVGKGDFVISMRSFQGGLEYSYVDGKISSAYVMLIPDKTKVYDEYFKWLFKTKSYIKALQGTSDLVRDGQALRYANFAKVSLPEIPLEEQKRIADYISTEVKKIDDAIPVFKKEIELLREYRTRLISDVVTGQVDVRGVEIPDYTPEEDNAMDEEINDTEEVTDSAD